MSHSSHAVDPQSKLSRDRGPAATYTNKEQLAILRRFYLENPTPTKSQILELASTTGRHWSKVKEYFRQRRNKLRGVDEASLDGMREPDRATSWYVTGTHFRMPTVADGTAFNMTGCKCRIGQWLLRRLRSSTSIWHINLDSIHITKCLPSSAGKTLSDWHVPPLENVVWPATMKAIGS